MLQLEDKIRKHADKFNEREPSAEHFSRFYKRLEEQAARRRIINRKKAFSYAATALALLSASYFTYYVLSNRPAQPSSSQVTRIVFSEELSEVLDYYEAVSKLKEDEIEQLAPSPEEAATIRKHAARQMENIDASLAQIEKEYMKDPGNEQFRALLVNTKRKKLEVMDQITRQMEISYSGYHAGNKSTIRF
ncbi:MAG: hypothetical protein L3J66_09995 [Bacteroidales bacterium]|nr:hypothetical protein [Bacteroidales bacterium]